MAVSDDRQRKDLTHLDHLLVRLEILGNRAGDSFHLHIRHVLAQSQPAQLVQHVKTTNRARFAVALKILFNDMSSEDSHSEKRNIADL
jgi:hypothetical protein